MHLLHYTIFHNSLIPEAWPNLETKSASAPVRIKADLQMGGTVVIKSLETHTHTHTHTHKISKGMVLKWENFTIVQLRKFSLCMRQPLYIYLVCTAPAGRLPITEAFIINSYSINYCLNIVFLLRHLPERKFKYK